MDEQTPQPPFSDEPASRSATAIRELRARAQTALAARRERMSHLERELFERLDTLSEALADERGADAKAMDDAAEKQATIERLQVALEHAQAARQKETDAEQARLEALRNDLSERENELAAREESLGQRDADLCQRQQELDARADQITKREQSLESARAGEDEDRKSLADREAAWQRERSGLEAERDGLAEKLEKLSAQHRTSSEEWKAQLADLERKLQDQQQAWDHQRGELEAMRAAVDAERDELSRELAAANEKLKAAGESAAVASEHNELKQKFELALADVQRFRSRVAELEQELARRPEAGGADSAELVHLRSERDALAARVEELERLPADNAIDANSEQQITDLQRRFEMAVEDVRELKTKNAELESQLAKARKGAAPASDTGGMDWESQKRRMLADLEGEGHDVEPQRQKERASIKSTIDITDAVIAEKDKELEELRAQLTGRNDDPSVAEDKRDEAIEKLVDADEIVAQYRERASQLEKDLEAKLRAAELELSVERAKIAREKAEVEEWRLEMETFRKAREAGEPQGVAGTPRRRWLSKLGLHGDEEK